MAFGPERKDGEELGRGRGVLGVEGDLGAGVEKLAGSAPAAEARSSRAASGLAREKLAALRRELGRSGISKICSSVYSGLRSSRGMSMGA